MLNNILYDLRRLVAPRTCPICGATLPNDEAVVCTMCEATAPLTYLWEQAENAMSERFWGLLPVERASAFVWYVEGSPWRDAVHSFKYGGVWRSAYNLGRWYGAVMQQAGHYADVDVVVPVPLHWLRRLNRGYNQSEHLAEGIARQMGLEVDSRSVVRHRYNPSQTRQLHSERWDNVEGIFRVRHPERLAGRHILLVDDVFTTGATIMSLGETILATVPDVRLSVAVLATTRRSLRLEP